MIDPTLAYVLGAAQLGWMLAATFVALWWAERDRRRAAERTGRYEPKASARPSDSAETRARTAVRKEEGAAVKALAQRLGQEARADGKKFTPQELEAEARAMLLQASGGRGPS